MGNLPPMITTPTQEPAKIQMDKFCDYSDAKESSQAELRPPPSFGHTRSVPSSISIVTILVGGS